MNRALAELNVCDCDPTVTSVDPESPPALFSAGITVLSKSKLADPRVRNQIINKLAKKKTRSGGSYLEQAQGRVLATKERRRFEGECSLGSTLLKISQPSRDCDLYRLTHAGRVCVGWRLCKKITEAVRSVLEEWGQ